MGILKLLPLDPHRRQLLFYSIQLPMIYQPEWLDVFLPCGQKAKPQAEVASEGSDGCEKVESAEQIGFFETGTATRVYIQLNS